MSAAQAQTMLENHLSLLVEIGFADIDSQSFFFFSYRFLLMPLLLLQTVKYVPNGIILHISLHQ